MNVLETLLPMMDEIFGIPEAELAENPDLDLDETDLVDSLGLVTLIEDLGETLNVKIDISRMNPEDFRTVKNIARAVEAQL